MEINKTLDKMVGKEWLHSPTRENVIVKKWSLSNDQLTIETDLKNFSAAFGDHHELIKEFLPVEEENKQGLTKMSTLAPAGSVFNANTLTSLKDTLMDNIKQVKENKEFLPQAQAINDQVKSVIELAKTEVEFYKTAAKLND